MLLGLIFQWDVEYYYSKYLITSRPDFKIYYNSMSENLIFLFN